MPHEPEKCGKASRSDGPPLPPDDSAISCPPPQKKPPPPPPLSPTSHVSVPPIAQSPPFSIPPHVLRVEGRDPSFRPPRRTATPPLLNVSGSLLFSATSDSAEILQLPARRASALPLRSPPRLPASATSTPCAAEFPPLSLRRPALQPPLRICRAPPQATFSSAHRPQHGLQRPPPSDARSAERLRPRDAPGAAAKFP